MIRWLTWALFGLLAFCLVALELAKAMLQFLVAVVLGTMATLVAGEFNRQRTEKDGSREEERRRADEFHKDLLRRLHQSYSNFKRTKRLLRAEAFTLPYYGTSNEEARVNLERYDQHLQVLNDIQLDLENMAKDAEANRTDFAHSQEIAAAIRPMEERLDKVIREYEIKRGYYAPDDPPKISDLPMLRDIVGPSRQGDIIRGFTIGYREAVKYIQHDVAVSTDDSPSPSGRETARPS